MLVTLLFFQIFKQSDNDHNNYVLLMLNHETLIGGLGPGGMGLYMSPNCFPTMIFLPIALHVVSGSMDGKELALKGK